MSWQDDAMIEQEQADALFGMGKQSGETYTRRRLTFPLMFDTITMRQR